MIKVCIFQGSSVAYNLRKEDLQHLETIRMKRPALGGNEVPFAGVVQIAWLAAYDRNRGNLYLR